MAILNPNKKPYIIDEDNDIFVGLDLPIRKSDGPEGYFYSTKTTLLAAKNNVRSFLMTNVGERLMQPTLGLNLKKYLFENYNEDLKGKITAEILDKFKFWLPYIEVQDLIVKMKEGDGLGGNTLQISVTFNIQKDSSSLEQVQVNIQA